MGKGKYGVKAKNYKSFDDSRHFIKSDISKDFLKKHEINMTVKGFRKFIDSIEEPDMSLETGDFSSNGKRGHTDVYDIHRVKRLIECNEGK